MPNGKEFTIAYFAPADVEMEAKLLPAVIEAVNRIAGVPAGYRLQLRRWEPASASSSQLPACDLLIGIFWTMLGESASGDAKTRAVQEIELAIERTAPKSGDAPKVALYFKTAPYFLQFAEQAAQLQKLLDFRSRMQEAPHLTADFQTEEEFRDRVQRDVIQVVQNNLQEPASLPLVSAQTRSGDVFQNFRIERNRGENSNAVSYMWADSFRANTLEVLIEQVEPPFLKISFQTAIKSYPSNVAIRPFGDRPLKRGAKTKLVFEARTERSDNPLALAIRIINGSNQHWAYGDTGQYRMFSLGPEWQPVEIPLFARHWWLFPADGSPFSDSLPPEQRFDVIAGVVVEFGGDQPDRPGAGRGVIGIRDVKLVD